MRIGYLVPEFPSQTHIFFWREVVALRAAGVDVHMVSTTEPPADSCRHAFADEARKETFYLFPPTARDVLAWLARPVGVVRVLKYVMGLRESSLKNKLKVMAMSLCSARFVALARRKGIDHLHVHSFADSAHVAAMAWLLGRIPFSLTLHGSLPNYGTDHAAKVRNATCISTDGYHLVLEIRKATDYPEERMLSTCMGVNTEHFRPGTVKPDGPAVIVTVARMEIGKGQHFAIEAVEQLRKEGLNVHYIAAGKGSATEKFTELARSKGMLDDSVFFPGTLAETEVLDLLRRATVFALPSFGSFEAYAIAVMEAMSCGVPVVASKIGALPEMIQSGHNGYLVSQQNVKELTDALRLLCADPELASRVSANARERAVAGFDVRETAPRLARFLARWSNDHKK